MEAEKKHMLRKNRHESGFSSRERSKLSACFNAIPSRAEQHMFITTNLRNRQRVFADPAYARAAVETLYAIQGYYPFFLFGFVFMPDHCHLLLNIPEGGSVSKMMYAFKRAVAFNVGQGPLWQSRFDLKIPNDSSAVLHYIHQNPVKAGLVNAAEDYPWSSACGRWDIMPLDYT